MIRLYEDFRPLLEGDHRIRLDFSVIPGSHVKHERAAHRYLRRLELAGKVTVVPWSGVEAYRPELIVSASPTAEVLKLGVPAVFITHGAGNNRLRDDLTGPYGLAREQLVWEGRVIDWLPLAGRAALRDLHRWCAEAVPHAEIMGDLRYERILESLRLRRDYRRALGLRKEDRLVVVSSTWGDLSLIGQGRLELPQTLLESLPMDSFSVGAVPHPNIEHGDGASIAAVLGPWLKNGLLMPPVEEGWAAMVIAADLVVGDSGSVTQYAAAIGKPILLSAFGYDQMSPDGELARFGRETPWLDLDKPLAPQIHDAIERGRVFDFDGVLASDRSPSRIIHAKVYEMLGIQPPEFPGTKTLPGIELHYRCSPTWAWRSEVEFHCGLARVTRMPVQSHKDAPGLLAVRFEDCDDNVMRTHAKVLLHLREALSEEDARYETEGLLEDWPNALLAAVRTVAGELLMRTGQGLLVRVLCELEQMEAVALVFAARLSEHPADAARLDAADALVDFQRGFEPPLPLLSVERLG
jgi:hypothetical protein